MKMDSSNRQRRFSETDDDEETNSSEESSEESSESGSGASSDDIPLKLMKDRDQRYNYTGRLGAATKDSSKSQRKSKKDVKTKRSVRLKNTWKNFWNRILKMWVAAEHLSSSSSDTDNEKTGYWDRWKAYYCTRKISRYDKFSRPYFSWALMIAIGKCSGTDLVEHCLRNGGGVFLIAVFVTYIGVGYPMLLLETMMGQYSGRKPLQLLRYLCPALSGIGPAIYFRTISVALYSLGFALYSMIYCVDLYFCKINTNSLLRGLHNTALEYPTFEFGTFSKGDTHYRIISPPVLLLLFGFFLGFGSIRANTIGRGYRLGLGILFVLLIIYVFTGFSRTRSPDQNSDSILFYPLQTVLDCHWEKLWAPQTWMEAVMFVINSLSLGTLSHMYLGSQLFFHYRTARDTLGIVILTFLWNILGLLGVLFWLGYVCVNRVQMLRSLKQIGGPYGVLVTFVMKHNQANLTSQLEGDIQFFCGFFYTIFGLAALLSLICHIQILAQCAYPEKVTPRVKLFIFVTICFIFALVAPFFILTDEGLRHFVFFDYYYVRSWSVFFTMGCFYWSVAYGHNFSKLAYDFRNIHHYRIMPAVETNSRIPRIARLPGLVCIIMTMIYFIGTIRRPVAGLTEFADQKIGIIISFIPVICVVVVGVIVLFTFEGFTRWNAFKPHRDWFKNHFHNRRCGNEEPFDDMEKQSEELEPERPTPPLTPAELLALHLTDLRRIS